MDWQHIFDPHGFPTIATYGKSWGPVMVWLFVWSRVLAAVAYLLLFCSFVGFLSAWKAKRIDTDALTVHGPRVLLFYMVSVTLEILLQFALIAVSWYPALRAVGILLFINNLALLVAGGKTVWALSQCTILKDKGS